MKRCSVCGREASGYYWEKPKDKKPDKRNRKWCCSMRCLDIIYERRGRVIDITEHEIAAIEAASEPAGQYIEALASTDMATWTRDQWLGFIECVVTGFQDAMREMAGECKRCNKPVDKCDCVPF